MVQRLLNIELSHLDLLTQGVQSGANWLLILEDDAFSADVAEVAAGIQCFTKNHAGSHLVNLSQSFTLEQLGLDKHLHEDPSDGWLSGSHRRLLRSNVPATNTVCAVLYSVEAAVRIRSQLEAMPIDPVLPIDWKLNMALASLDNDPSQPAVTSWFVDPAPIEQLSMQNS
jgi:GR25 family glycosyltransferase involved in LPS biosynthesis